MRIRLPLFLYSVLPFPPGRTFPLVLAPAFFLVSLLLLPAPGYAADPSEGRQLVPERTIQLKEDKEVAWKGLWDQGRELARNGRLTEAVPVYEALLVMREGLEAARWELVTILLQLKREGAALPHLELLLETAPGNFQYLLALAEARRVQGNTARAVDLYRKVLKRQPGNLLALRGAASALLALQKKGEAAAMLEELLRRDPARRGLREELGNLYFEMGAYDMARAHFTLLLRENHSDPAILLKMAQAYDRSGLESKALESWLRLERTTQSPEAREWLTNYYLKGGKGADVLAYLLPLFEKEPSSPRLLKRIGQINLSLSRYSEALAFLEQYISLKPEDREVLRQVIDLHALLGNKGAGTLLGRGLRLASAPNLENLERVAGRYEATGELREALVLYDQILAVTPDDPKILAKRAKVLLASSDDDQANAMWAHLERRQKLLQVLELLFKMEPENRTVLEKLARMYLDRGELRQSLEMFSRLEALGVRTPEVLTGQALAYERLGRPAKALALYEQLLNGADETGIFRLRCLQLAGGLGLFEKTRNHIGRLQEEFPGLYDSSQVQLLIAKALTEIGSHGMARQSYSAMLTQYPADKELGAAVLFGLAEAYRLSGLPYEAEQTLRQAYLHDPRNEVVLVRLFDLTLEEKRFAEARVWLAQLTQDEARGKLRAAGRLGQESLDPRFLRARLLAAEGETGAAIKILAQLVGQVPESAADGLHSRREIVLLLARLLFADGRYAEAEQLALSLAAQQQGNPEADLLLLRIYRRQGKSGAEKELFQRMQAEFTQDLGLVLAFLKGLKNEGMLAELVEGAELASNQYPDSVTIRYLAASAREDKGEIDAALVSWQGIVRDFPEQDFAAMHLARHLFLRGRFGEARAIVGQFAHIAVRPDMVLLKARILWAEQEWEGSVAVYEAFLSPPVADNIAAEASVRGMALPREEEPGLWKKMTVAEIERPTVLDALMEPEALLDSGTGASVYKQLVTPFYARYRWQKQFALEKTARQAVLHREYLAAANYFRTLLREYPVNASLQFDLAGIYSRFGQLGHEAALYEEITDAGVGFPGLAEARQRNELKRRPQTSLGYGYLTEEGREGNKAIRKSWAGARLQYSPYLQHDLEVNLARLDYQNTNGQGKIIGTRALASYAANINEYLLLRGGAGAELLEGDQPNTFLLALAAEGRLGDRLTGILSYNRDVNHDTLASLSRNIVQQDYKANFVLDMVSSLQAGGGYLHTDFSDDNTLEGYDLWAAYLVFFEPAFLRFSYTYDFKDAAESGNGGPLQADGFSASDHPYWTPINYWQNRFSVYFKHQLSDDQFRRGVPRHYDLEYVLVYDEMGYAMQTLKGGVFVEYAPQFIFSATGALTSGQDYRSKELFLSAVYRW